MINKFTGAIFLLVLVVTGCTEDPVYNETYELSLRRVTTSSRGIIEGAFWKESKNIIYAEELTSRITLIKTAEDNGSTPRRIYDTGKADNFIVSDDNSLVAFEKTVITDSGTVSGITVVSETGEVLYSPFEGDDTFIGGKPAAFSPDNSYLLANASFDNDGNVTNGICYYNLEDDTYSMFENDMNAEAVDLSPDGYKILYAALANDSTFQVYTMNTDGTGKNQLTSGLVSMHLVGYSPQGYHILLSALVEIEGSMYRQVFIMAPDGTSLRQLTGSPYYNVPAAISPDGRYILYSSQRDVENLSDTDVFVFDLVTGIEITALDRDYDDRGIMFSTDNQNRILLFSDEIGVDNLYVYDFGAENDL